MNDNDGAAFGGTLDSLVRCPDCGGDGHETCHNPDHGFIGAVEWHENGRLGCPVCGHDPDHKVPGGEGRCETCNGTGKVSSPNVSHERLAKGDGE